MSKFTNWKTENHEVEIKKQSPALCHLQEMHFKLSGIGRLTEKDGTKKYHDHISQKSRSDYVDVWWSRFQSKESY